MNLETMEELNFWAEKEAIELTEENQKRLEAALQHIAIPEVQQFARDRCNGARCSLYEST